MMSFYYLKFQKEIPKQMLFSTQNGGNLIQLDYDSFPYIFNIANSTHMNLIDELVFSINCLRDRLVYITKDELYYQNNSFHNKLKLPQLFADAIKDDDIDCIYLVFKNQLNSFLMIDDDGAIFRWEMEQEHYAFPMIIHLPYAFSVAFNEDICIVVTSTNIAVLSLGDNDNVQMIRLDFEILFNDNAFCQIITNEEYVLAHNYDLYTITQYQNKRIYHFDEHHKDNLIESIAVYNNTIITSSIGSTVSIIDINSNTCIYKRVFAHQTYFVHIYNDNLVIVCDKVMLQYKVLSLYSGFKELYNKFIQLIESLLNHI